nr:hypothetical protein [Tanacetum cinerariifolium]
MGVHLGNPQHCNWLMGRVVQSTIKIMKLKGNQGLKARIRDGGAYVGDSISVMPFLTYLNLGLFELAYTKLIVELADRTVKYPKGVAENILVDIGKFVFPIDFIILDMPEDVKVPLIFGRPFLSTAHTKIDVFKRKITLRVGDEKIIFKSVKPASILIKRAYMLSLRERMELDLEARLMGETLVESYNSIMMDKVEYKGKNVVRAFMNVPVFVRKFSIVTRFVVVENIDGYRDQDIGDINLREPFCKDSCVEARRFDVLITIHNGSDNVTYQMARSHPKFKHLSNAQCNKIKPLLKHGLFSWTSPDGAFSLILKSCSICYCHYDPLQELCVSLICLYSLRDSPLVFKVTTPLAIRNLIIKWIVDPNALRLLILVRPKITI